MANWIFMALCILIGALFIVLAIPQQSMKRMAIYFCLGLAILFFPIVPYMKDQSREDNRCKEAGGVMLRTNGNDVCIDANVIIELN